MPVKPTIPTYRRHFLVCVGKSCAADGMTPQALDLVGRKLVAAGLLVEGTQRVKPSRVDCLGACRSGPVVCVQPEGIWYCGVTPQHMDRIIKEHLQDDCVVDDLVFHRGPSAYSGS